jgi:hypothetical protein
MRLTEKFSAGSPFCFSGTAKDSGVKASMRSHDKAAEAHREEKWCGGRGKWNVTY